jgi:hypothetical protein
LPHQRGDNPPITPNPRISRLRLIVALLSAAALAFALAGDGVVGADCGDAIRADGTEAFTCNTGAYAQMILGAIGFLGLVASLLWALVGRRSR